MSTLRLETLDFENEQEELAFSRGGQLFRAGAALEDSPYVAGSYYDELWRAGWVLAKRMKLVRES